jgi:uncharacterized membrane protein
MLEKDIHSIALPTSNQHPNQLLSIADREQNIYRAASRIGIVAGLRSMIPLAFLIWTSDQEHNTLPEAIEKRSLVSVLETAAGLAVLGEIIADKLPFTPSRLKTGQFLGRLIIGAVAGTVICKRANQSPFEGAIRGAIGAGIGTIAGYTYRTFFTQTTSMPDIVLASIEDIIALGIGWQAVQHNK